jgi:outer membrane DcaP-like protein
MAVRTAIRAAARAALLVACVTVAATAARAQAAGPSPEPPAATQAAPDAKPSFDIYGFAMLDMGHNFTQIHPDWFDTLRLTKLPSYKDEYGADNNTFSGVRQSRLGFKSSTPTDLGELKTIFEFELFGTGVDAGQTTFRLRHAWGELGQFGAGQYWSPFTDPDAFPNSLEYWGPTGLAWYRNVQIRWTPISDAHNTFMVALERPGASGDGGVYADRIELQNIKARFPVPDFTAAYKTTMGWGYFRVAGQLRYIKWDDTLADNFNLSGSATGWGVNLSSNVNVGKHDVVRLAFVTGAGIQNSMNDSPVDIGLKLQPGNTVTPVTGEAVPLQAVSLFLDHSWNEKTTTAIGYSMQDNQNTDGQAPDAFHIGHYFLGNVLYSPVKNAMFGGEFQWGRRENNSDGFHSDGVKVQFSFKYNFSVKLGGQ